MSEQLNLLDALQARDAAMEQVAANAELLTPPFADRATVFVLDYLRSHGRSSGEEITDACIKSGVAPHDQRAFGPVYKRLSVAGKIRICGFCLRRKGHATSGGHIWEIVDKESQLPESRRRQSLHAKPAQEAL